MSGNQLGNTVDSATVAVLTTLSIAPLNEYLTTIGLIIAIPIGVLRLAVAWRDFKGGKS